MSGKAHSTTGAMTQPPPRRMGDWAIRSRGETTGRTLSSAPLPLCPLFSWPTTPVAKPVLCDCWRSS